MARPRICVIGSLNMDLVVRTPRFAQPGETILGGPFATYPGGKGANQAVAAARLGADVSFVGCVGEDAYGEEFRRVLQFEGIDVTHLQTKKDVATGVGVIAIDERGQNSIIVALGANLALTPADVDAAMEVIQAADVVMLQLEIPMETNAHVLARGEEFKAAIMLNAAPAQRVADAILEEVDVLIFNEVEGAAIASQTGKQPSKDDLIQHVPYGGNAIKVMTLGDCGAVSCTAGDTIEDYPAFQVATVDTVGAGDCFCGALAVALAEDPLAEVRLADAIRFASAAAALSVTRHGAIPSMPKRVEVEVFLRGHASAPGRAGN